jgi:hypothetical protein
MRALIAAGIVYPVLALAALAQTAPPPQAGQPAREAGELRSAAELARICAAESNTAVGQYYEYGYCFGYTTGALHYNRAITPANAPPIFCAPSPAPTFEAMRGKYVAWVNAAPENGSMRAIESVFAFLRTEYPCPTPPAPARRR